MTRLFPRGALIARADRTRTNLASCRAELRKIDPGLGAGAIEAIVHSTALHPAEILSEKFVKSLVRETTRMVAGFLRDEIAARSCSEGSTADRSGRAQLSAKERRA